MPNGKPGDHPYTDIVVHGSSSEFGEEISALVREMARHPGFAAVREEVVDILESVAFRPQSDKSDAVMKETMKRLVAVKAKLG